MKILIVSGGMMDSFLCVHFSVISTGRISYYHFCSPKDQFSYKGILKNDLIVEYWNLNKWNYIFIVGF